MTWRLRRFRRYRAILVSALLGTLMTVGAFLLVCSWEYRVAVIDFERKAANYVDVVNFELGDARTLMLTFAAFMESNDRPVSAREFARFSAASRERVSALRDTAWAPRVTFAARNGFEHAVRAAGHPGYRIVQLGPRGTIVPAARRAAYFPLVYIQSPGSARHTLLGLDLTFEPVRAAAVRRALRARQPAATPPMDVVTVRQPGAGVLCYMPVYGGPDAQRGKDRVAGIVLGVFDIPAIVKHAARNRLGDGLALYLDNPAAAPGRRVLYRSPGAQDPLTAGASWQSTVTVIDRPLRVTVTPVVPLHRIHLSMFTGATLVTGAIVTAMTVLYLLVVLRRTQQLEALTRSLAAKTEEVVEMSQRDALTGIPNRLLFRSWIDELLADLRADDPFALLYLDLDGFKAVNDTFGHGTGDRLLCTVAKRIQGCMREGHKAARLGGDEFAIVLAGAANETLTAAAADRLVATIGQPYTIDGHTVGVGVSIGVAFAQPGMLPETLIAEADVAMYEAKAAGGGMYRFFAEQMRERAANKTFLQPLLVSTIERA